MSEVQFCRQFLSALDARPIKLSSDHIADPRRYPAQGAYILPRLPHPPHPARPAAPSQPTTSGQDATSTGSDLTISLTPMKSSFPTVPMSSIDASTTSIFDLKQAYASATSIPVSKIKILWKKKPASDSKTIAEVVGQDAGAQVEFTVMVMGSAVAAAGSPVTSSPVTSPPAVAPREAEKGIGGEEKSVGGPAAQGPSGKEVVATAEFWDDLKGFVFQRIRDEKEGERLVGVFKAAWEKDR